MHTIKKNIEILCDNTYLQLLQTFDLGTKLDYPNTEGKCDYVC